MPRGVQSGGAIYLATPSTELDLAAGSPAGTWVMRLVVLDAGGPILDGAYEPLTPAEPPAPAPPWWSAVEWRMLGDADERLGFVETWRRLFGTAVERLDRQNAP